jgi:hypothetical protein
MISKNHRHNTENFINLDNPSIKSQSLKTKLLELAEEYHLDSKKVDGQTIDILIDPSKVCDFFF